MSKCISLIATALLGGLLLLNSACTREVKPLRVLLITGGCCHDYTKQKDVLKQGLEARAHVVVDQVHVEIPAGTSATKPPLPIYGNADYAKGYDVVIHDECASDINEPAIIKAVLAPHQAGIPAVNLHCAMHSYRIGDANEPATAGSERALWFDYLGLQSSAHGAQLPIAIHFTDPASPITHGLTDWTTVNEELYNNIHVYPAAKILAQGKQVSINGAVTTVVECVSVWTHDYHGTRVFSTTLGHNTATTEDARYLDLVTRGLLWACDKLDAKGNIAKGYGPKQ